MSAERAGGDRNKTAAAEGRATTTQEQKPAEGTPGQEGPRHTEVRDSQHDTRSHKSISRLTGSPPRLDSAGQMYRFLHAHAGQRHE